MFAVAVTFVLHPDGRAAFHEAVKQQARDSLRLETACRQFDVCISEQRPDEVFLYEIYDSAEAFGEHLASNHFLGFDAKVKPLVASKQVSTWTILDCTLPA